MPEQSNQPPPLKNNFARQKGMSYTHGFAAITQSLYVVSKDSWVWDILYALKQQSKKRKK